LRGLEARAHRRRAHRQRRAAVRSSGQTRPAPLGPCRSDLSRSSRGSHRVGAQPHSRAAAGSVEHPSKLESAHRRRRAGRAGPGSCVGSGTLPAQPPMRPRRTMKGVVGERICVPVVGTTHHPRVVEALRVVLPCRSARPLRGGCPSTGLCCTAASGGSGRLSRRWCGPRSAQGPPHLEPSSACSEAGRVCSACSRCTRAAARGLSCGRAEAASTDAEGSCSNDLHPLAAG